MAAPSAARRKRRSAIERLSSAAERRTGMAAKYELPAELGLLVAVLGMYWDVGWHIDLGRDKGLLTIPHMLIVTGIALCVLAGWAALVIPGHRSPGSVRLGNRTLPVGGMLLLICGGVALAAFPLDGLWHALFGEDVTLWGPTHILMIAGASLCSLAIAVLAFESRQLRASFPHRLGPRPYFAAGAFLVALSTLQAEFDFGVPQFQLLFQPIMISIAAAIGLVFARATLGRFGAIGAVLAFYVIRGALALIVGGALDHTLPHFPLYMASAICVELIALARWRNGLAFGAAAGLAAGTVGLAGEWGWTQLWMPHGWTTSMLPDALVLSALAGAGAGIIGARIAAAVGASQPAAVPRSRASTMLVGASVATLIVALAIPLPRGADTTTTMTVKPFDVRGGSARLLLALSKPDYDRNAEWFEVLSWQGGSSKRVALAKLSPTRYETKTPVPYGGNWKTMVRAAHGSKLVAAPVYLPAEPATDSPELPLERRTVAMQRDTTLLMRESKRGVGALATPAYFVVAMIATGWLVALAFALARVRGPRPRPGLRCAGKRAAALHAGH